MDSILAKLDAVLNSRVRVRRGRKEVKLNIHIPIRGRALQYCLDLNRRICDNIKNEIDFSPQSFHVPHVTLDMGYVCSTVKYEQIVGAVNELAKDTQSFELRLLRPFIKEPDRNYIFVEVLENEALKRLRFIVNSKIHELLEPLPWDVFQEAPHVTVGFVRKNVNTIEDMISAFPSGPIMTAESIDISVCGIHGTCIGTMKSFEFLDS